MGPIIAVIATLVVLFLAWMLLFRDGFGDGDDAGVTETPTAEVEQEEEPADAPDVNINIPGGDDSGEQSGAGDQGGGQQEGTEGTGAP